MPDNNFAITGSSAFADDDNAECAGCLTAYNLRANYAYTIAPLI